MVDMHILNVRLDCEVENGSSDACDLLAQLIEELSS